MWVAATASGAILEIVFCIGAFHRGCPATSLEVGQYLQLASGKDRILPRLTFGYVYPEMLAISRCHGKAPRENVMFYLQSVPYENRSSAVVGGGRPCLWPAIDTSVFRRNRFLVW